MAINQHTKSELHRHTGYDRRYIDKILDPVEPDGEKEWRGQTYPTYTLKTFVNAILANEGHHASGLTDEQRLKRAQADKAELEVAEKVGDLLPTDQVVEAWGRLVTNARQRLLALPSSAATELVGVDKATTVQKILTRYIYEALTELSEYRCEDFEPGGCRNPANHANGSNRC